MTRVSVAVLTLASAGCQALPPPDFDIHVSGVAADGRAVGNLVDRATGEVVSTSEDEVYAQDFALRFETDGLDPEGSYRVDVWSDRDANGLCEDIQGDVFDPSDGGWSEDVPPNFYDDGADIVLPYPPSQTSLVCGRMFAHRHTASIGVTNTSLAPSILRFALVRTDMPSVMSRTEGGWYTTGGTATISWYGPETNGSFAVDAFFHQGSGDCDPADDEIYRFPTPSPLFAEDTSSVVVDSIDNPAACASFLST